MDVLGVLDRIGKRDEDEYRAENVKGPEDFAIRTDVMVKIEQENWKSGRSDSVGLLKLK